MVCNYEYDKSCSHTAHTHTHHGYLPGLWDAVLHDACHVSDGEVDVLLTEVFLAAVAFLMVMQAFITVICVRERGMLHLHILPIKIFSTSIHQASLV